jgi:hypothetical protein
MVNLAFAHWRYAWSVAFVLSYWGCAAKPPTHSSTASDRDLTQAAWADHDVRISPVLPTTRPSTQPAAPSPPSAKSSSLDQAPMAPPSPRQNQPPTYDKPVADLSAWLQEHQVSGQVTGTCFEVNAGVPPVPSLLCRGQAEKPSSVVFERLLRPTDDGQRLQLVWQGAVEVYGNWVSLVVDIDPSGNHLELLDRSVCHCERAIREDREKIESNVQPDWLSRDLRRACGSRGLYVWSKNRYLRSKKPATIGCMDPVEDLDLSTSA